MLVKKCWKYSNMLFNSVYTIQFNLSSYKITKIGPFMLCSNYISIIVHVVWLIFHWFSVISNLERYMQFFVCYVIHYIVWISCDKSTITLKWKTKTCMKKGVNLIYPCCKSLFVKENNYILFRSYFKSLKIVI